MKPIILFRRDISNFNEFNICKDFFEVCEQRSCIPRRSLVIPRYSALPYYHELEIDVHNFDSRLINRTDQHRWIAEAHWIQDPDIKPYTPATYCDYDFNTAPEGSYIVKGKTNSRKQHWNKKMLALNKVHALNIAGELIEDDMLAQQGLIYRQYIPLETWEVGLNGLRFANEWRFFFLGETLIDYGYYWSIASDETLERAKKEPILPFYEFAHKIAKIAAKYTNFFVLDVAKTETGHIILIEINDGSMSGLSEIPAIRFYKNLKDKINDQYTNTKSRR